MNMIKAIILHNIMAPYRLPLFTKIAKFKNIDLEVWFLSKSAKNRRWKLEENPRLPFKYKVLQKIEINFFAKDLFTWIFNPTFPWELLRSNYDVLICAGWLDFASQIGLLMCKILKRPYILWSESTINEPSWRRKLSLPLVKWIVNQADAYIATGTRAKEYLISLGANPEKIFVGISTVDIQHFQRESRMSKKEKETIKRKHQIKTKKIILFVGQFIERKGLRYLIRAFGEAKKRNDDIGLVLVGSGPLKSELAEICLREKIDDVYFIDHLEIDQLPKIYGLADLFILPSCEETWGLVINEAMACSLPVIATDKVGASVDLIKNGINGYVIKDRNIKDLSLSIEKIINNENLTKKMGKNSGDLINNFGPDNQAKAFKAAINHVLWI